MIVSKADWIIVALALSFGLVGLGVSIFVIEQTLLLVFSGIFFIFYLAVFIAIIRDWILERKD